MDAALVDYRTEHLALYARGLDFLAGRDAFGQGYLDFMRQSTGVHARLQKEGAWEQTSWRQRSQTSAQTAS